MATVWKRVLLVGVLIVGLISRSPAQESATQVAAGSGTLIVLVTWGDINNTPANDVYIEAHTSSAKSLEPASYVLKQVRAGRYESTLPPGIYDVFISEGNSVPRCKRVQIRPKYQTYWTVKLEDDDVYMNKN